MSTASSTREPDPDTIKMFVGQIPRSWGEDECRELFEQFGSVYQLNVLRDKTTQASRGCCFVTFYRRADAIGAQAALHNIRVLPQMHHPIQMKPADSENRNERKLFVGMLNKKLTEEDVKRMFVPFGHIEDCTVLKDADGKSRGCAFVTFANRAYAQQAIKQMHHTQTMEGCTTPIVVKFADTQKEKDAKRSGSSSSPTVPATTNIAASIQQLLQSNQPCFNATANPALGAQLSALATLLQGGAQPNVLSILGNAAALQQQQQQQQQQLAAIQQQQRLLELFSQQQIAAVQVQPATADLSAYLAASQASGVPITFATAATESPSFSAASIAQGGSPSDAKGSFMFTNGGNNLIQLTGPAASPSSFDALQHAYAGMQQYAAAFPQLAAAGQPLIMNSAPAAIASPTAGGGQSKGPDGCNLFIYHLPQDFTDSDLITTFSPFGNILSAKVFIDKQTNLSKCFGFVSYDNVLSAQNAISALNGFQIGSKRLKVQLKRGKDSKPYGGHPQSGVTNGAAALLT